MKRLTRVLLLAIMAASATSVTYAQAKPKMTDEQALIALDKRWTAAELRLNDEDRKTIDRIVSADYWGTTPFGQIENKQQYMAGLKSTTDTDVADEYVVRFYDGGKLAAMTHRGTSTASRPTAARTCG